MRTIPTRSMLYSLASKFPVLAIEEVTKVIASVYNHYFASLSDDEIIGNVGIVPPKDLRNYDDVTVFFYWELLRRASEKATMKKVDLYDLPAEVAIEKAVAILKSSYTPKKEPQISLIGGNQVDWEKSPKFHTLEDTLSYIKNRLRSVASKYKRSDGFRILTPERSYDVHIRKEVGSTEAYIENSSGQLERIRYWEVA